MIEEKAKRPLWIASVVIDKCRMRSPMGSVRLIGMNESTELTTGIMQPFHGIFVHQMQDHSTSVALSRSRLYNYHDSIDGVTGRAQRLVSLVCR